MVHPGARSRGPEIENRSTKTWSVFTRLGRHRSVADILEFLTSALYYSPDADHHEILAKVLEVFEEDKAGGLPKELLDIGIRSAIKAGQTEDAVRLARSGKSSVSPSYHFKAIADGKWKTQWAGAACTAHDAFLAAGEYDGESIHTTYQQR